MPMSVSKIGNQQDSNTLAPRAPGCRGFYAKEIAGQMTRDARTTVQDYSDAVEPLHARELIPIEGPGQARSKNQPGDRTIGALTLLGHGWICGMC